jgi:hypothetical protein
MTGAGFWDTGELTAAFKSQGFTVNYEIIDQKEERLVTEKDIANWFNAGQSRWGEFMGSSLKKADFDAIEQSLRRRIEKGPILWRWKSVCLRADTGSI